MKLVPKLSQEKKNILVGGVLSSLVDSTVDHVLYRVNALYGVSVRDTAGNWIIGIGTGDLLNFGIGAGLAYYGAKKRKQKLKDMGFGWMLAATTNKIAELSNYMQVVDPIVLNGETVITVPLKQARVASGSLSGSRGKYNNTSLPSGYVGAYLKPVVSRYAPR